jgi:ribosomal protein L40E
MFCPKCGTENPETGKFCRSCGTDLSGVSKALKKKSSNSNDLWGTSGDLWGNSADQNDMWQTSGNQKELTNPDDIFGAGVRSVIVGFGFLAVSMALLFTGVAGGKSWWWAMLFPSFFSFANGVSQILKANRMNRNAANANPAMQNQIPPNQPNLNLPPNQTEYVKPQNSIYDTGELAPPPSVTEQTTKHLEMNSEGETMTLPKK